MEIKELKPSEAEELWRRLYEKNPANRPFQSPAVIKALSGLPYELRSFRELKRPSGLRFYTVFDEKRALICLPARKCADNMLEVLGGAEGLGGIDGLYGSFKLPELENAFRALLDYLKNKNFSGLKWLRIEEESVAYKLIHSCVPPEMLSVETEENVRIYLNKSCFEEYKKSLSKSVRQNIRTAYNRLNRDGLEHELIFHCYCDENLSKKEYEKLAHSELEVAVERHAQRYSHSSALHKFALRHLHYLSKSVCSEQGFLAELRIQGRAAAVMQGYVDYSRRSLEVPRLAIDRNRGFYSPGLLMLFELVEKFYAEDSYREINLLRGTEKYKTDMGGEIYLNEMCCIKF